MHFHRYTVMQVQHPSLYEDSPVCTQLAAWLGPWWRLQWGFLLVFYHRYTVYTYFTCVVKKKCCLCFAGCSNEAAHLKFVVAQTSHCVALFLTLALKFRERIRAGVQSDFPLDPGSLLPTAAAAAGSLIYHFYYLIKESHWMEILFLAMQWSVCRFTVLKRLH